MMQMKMHQPITKATSIQFHGLEISFQDGARQKNNLINKISNRREKEKIFSIVPIFSMLCDFLISLTNTILFDKD
jgi:hypothetical protein